ncbi:MAG: thioredoxin domain-containing protein [Deltaproteobacteria bacterium]|nr:thioredoxin domain-containing protein [Deltaproteobacteria bacterium]
MPPLEVVMHALVSPAPPPRRRLVTLPSMALALVALAHSAPPAAAQAPAPRAAPAEEPRLRVPGDAAAPQRGPADALVTLVEFSDFQCPFCGRVQATLTELQQRYGRDLRIVWRNLPLSFHQDAQPAAEAAMAAHAAGRFWSMHDLLFQNQRALDRASLEQHATQLGLDLATFRDALDRRRYRAVVEADARLAAALGISGTPSFVINGRKLVGAQPVDAFVTVIDEEVARARRLLAALARVVEAAGYSTFLPQRDGLEAYLLRFVDSPLNVRPLRTRLEAAIFAVDVYQIVERCAAVVCNLNGRVPDEGGVAEAAIAFAAGRPVVLYKDDRRSVFAGRDNPMVTALSPLPPITDVRRIPAALQQLLRGPGSPPGAGGGRLRAAVSTGRRIWRVMERAPAALGKDRTAQSLVAEITAACAARVSAPRRSGRSR